MQRRQLMALAVLAAAIAAPAFSQSKEVKIAVIASKTGPLEAYAKQTIVGFNMGLDYATGGTMMVAGKKLVVIEKDDQGKPAVNKKEQRRAAAEARERDKGLRNRAKQAEAELERLTNSLSTVDAAMFDPASAPADLAKLTMTDLMKRRAEVQQAVAAAELAWLEASEALEGMAV